MMYKLYYSRYSWYICTIAINMIQYEIRSRRGTSVPRDRATWLAGVSANKHRCTMQLHVNVVHFLKLMWGTRRKRSAWTLVSAYDCWLQNCKLGMDDSHDTLQVTLGILFMKALIATRKECMSPRKHSSMYYRGKKFVTYFFIEKPWRILPKCWYMYCPETLLDHLNFTPDLKMVTLGFLIFTQNSVILH